MESVENSSALVGQQGGKPSILCSVCIATYQRPLLLERLLKSLEGQLLPDAVNLEIIVVDNDADRSAENIVLKYQDRARIRFSYFNQPIRSISHTRNMGVEKATGEYILFIDDDEVASTQWVSNLLDTLFSYDADGVFGQVAPEFNPQTPAWMHRGDFFFVSVPATGTKATYKYTGNCIIRASLLKGIKEPFDPRYGLTGGEDRELFNRLEHQGARFVYCKEALTSEYLPPDKTRLSYLFNCSVRRYGAAPGKKRIEVAGKKRILVRLHLLTKAVSYGMISIVFMIIFFPRKVRRVQWFLRLGVNIGRFLAVFGWPKEDYQWYRQADDTA